MECSLRCPNISGAMDWVCARHTALRQLRIPIDILVSLRGRRFDVHPLDLVVRSISDNAKCVGSIVPQELAVGGGEFDILGGVVFLKNVYTMCDDPPVHLTSISIDECTIF